MVMYLLLMLSQRILLFEAMLHSNLVGCWECPNLQSLLAFEAILCEIHIIWKPFFITIQICSCAIDRWKVQDVEVLHRDWSTDAMQFPKAKLLRNRVKDLSCKCKTNSASGISNKEIKDKHRKMQILQVLSQPKQNSDETEFFFK